MRRLVLLALALLPSVADAQSSQFGVRALGLPGRSLSTRAIGLGGAIGMLDGESSVNPAALATLGAFTAAFNGIQSYRRSENPAGAERGRSTRFPQVLVAGPIRRFPLTLGVSYSNYADRDFRLGTVGTIELRGVTVGITDTLTSRGGLNDIRFAAAYRLSARTIVGAGFHVITGSNRFELRRFFADDAYADFSQRAELSYAGIGVSAGVLQQLGPRLVVGGVVRSDGHVTAERDSTRVSQVDLPFTFGAGFRLQPLRQVGIIGQGMVRTWSGANSDLLAEGAAGASNTYDISAGIDFAPDPGRPFRRPVRLGFRYSTLPFLLVADRQPREVAVSVGTGARFAAQRAAIDLALERVWRSDGPTYSETAWQVSIGVSVRP